MAKLPKIDLANTPHPEIPVANKALTKTSSASATRLAVFASNAAFNFLMKIIEMCYLKKKKSSFTQIKIWSTDSTLKSF